MSLKSDIEIAQEVAMQPISEVAAQLGMGRGTLEPYGHYKAKTDIHALKNIPRKIKLILVTVISPTPAGEGKTTTSVGLTDALSRLGKEAALCLREPSLGPVFGVKGSVVGGGCVQVAPMEDINLHFTGDFRAVGAANDLISALVDNHIRRGNELNIDPREIVWKRVLDMDDRQLRHAVCGPGRRADDVPREDEFDITAAFETVAVPCLSTDLNDLKMHFPRMIVVFTRDSEPVTTHDLHAEGAMAVLLKDAIKPNLVQTLEHTPALTHGGPLANIAHGRNSVAAIDTAMKLGDYVVIEAGFGADLGAEKFADIKCHALGLKSSVVVTAATVRALKRHDDVAKVDLGIENLGALKKGFPNLLQHVENVTEVYGLPCVVAINAFPTDTAVELSLVEEQCGASSVNVALNEIWAKGDEGGHALAEEVLRLREQPNYSQYVYDVDDSTEDKLNAIATKVYRTDGVDFTPVARKQLKQLTELGFDKLSICMAKIQFSFSDDAALSRAPQGFCITVRNLRVVAGAGSLVALTGSTMTMFGLPKVPSADKIDMDSEGRIAGPF